MAQHPLRFEDTHRLGIYVHLEYAIRYRVDHIAELLNSGQLSGFQAKIAFLELIYYVEKDDSRILNPVVLERLFGIASSLMGGKWELTDFDGFMTEYGSYRESMADHYSRVPEFLADYEIVRGETAYLWRDEADYQFHSALERIKLFFSALDNLRSVIEEGALPALLPGISVGRNGHGVPPDGIHIVPERKAFAHLSDPRSNPDYTCLQLYIHRMPMDLLEMASNSADSIEASQRLDEVLGFKDQRFSYFLSMMKSLNYFLQQPNGTDWNVRIAADKNLDNHLQFLHKGMIVDLSEIDIPVFNPHTDHRWVFGSSEPDSRPAWAR